MEFLGTYPTVVEAFTASFFVGSPTEVAFTSTFFTVPLATHEPGVTSTRNCLVPPAARETVHPVPVT